MRWGIAPKLERDPSLTLKFQINSKLRLIPFSKSESNAQFIGSQPVGSRELTKLRILQEAPVGKDRTAWILVDFKPALTQGIQHIQEYPQLAKIP